MIALDQIQHKQTPEKVRIRNNSQRASASRPLQISRGTHIDLEAGDFYSFLISTTLLFPRIRQESTVLTSKTRKLSTYLIYLDYYQMFKSTSDKLLTP